MKIRVTILAENGKPRPEGLTENLVIAAWQVVMNTMCLMSDSNDRVTIEGAEFIEDGEENET